MLKDAVGASGVALLYALMFCFGLTTAIAYFHIESVYLALLVAKVLSLMGLAAFGQSEALKFYTSQHSTKSVGLEKWINSTGIFCTFSVVALILLKIILLKSPNFTVDAAPDENPSLKWLFHFVESYGEILSFLPIVVFAGVNVSMWLRQPGTRAMGRVCFVVSDLPVLAPIGIIFMLRSFFGARADDHDAKLALGGATVMFVLVSIFLNECAKRLLHGAGSSTHDSPQPRR